MKIVPAIDLREGKVVRLKQGRLSEITTYGADPMEVARRWEAEGATLLHVVDLDGAFSAKPQFELIERIIGAVKIPVEVGGGLRAIETAARYLRAGAKRVIFGTVVIQDEGVVIEAMKRFPEAVAIAVDAKNGVVQVGGWHQVTSVKVEDLVPKLAAWKTPRIQYTDIARDGMMTGPNIEAIRGLALLWTGGITVAGGVSSPEDVSRLRGLAAEFPHIDEVIVGKALYEDKLTLRGDAGLSGLATMEIPVQRRPPAK